MNDVTLFPFVGKSMSTRGKLEKGKRESSRIELNEHHESRVGVEWICVCQHRIQLNGKGQIDVELPERLKNIFRCHKNARSKNKLFVVGSNKRISSPKKRDENFRNTQKQFAHTFDVNVTLMSHIIF